MSYFYMYRAIYYHHAVRAAYLLFQDIIWEAFEKYDLKEKLTYMLSPDFWCHFDDHYFLTTLRELDENIRIRVEKLIFRKLPKLIPPQKLYRENIYRIYRFLEKASFKKKVEKEREIVSELRKKFIVEKIFLDSPMVIPYPRSLLAEGGIYIWEENTEEPQNIAEYSPYLLSLPDAAEMQLAARIYVFPSDLRSNEYFIKEINLTDIAAYIVMHSKGKDPLQIGAQLSRKLRMSSIEAESLFTAIYAGKTFGIPPDIQKDVEKIIPTYSFYEDLKKILDEYPVA